MLRVLTLSSLFPTARRPNFGIFVERQTLGLAARDDVELRVVSPVGLPPWPLSWHAHYDHLRDLPLEERWKGVPVYRPRFLALPATQGRFHAAMLRRALVPVLDRMRRDFAFDVIDASFFFPDGVAAIPLARRYGVPVSIKARGSDVHIWGEAPATRGQVIAAGQAADGLLTVSAAMRADMIAMGLPAERVRVHRTGVDLDRFRPLDRTATKAGLGITGPLVLSVGALIERKGHHLVMDAVAGLPGVTLAIAGEGAEKAALIAQAERLGIADRVRVLGGVPHAELPRWFAAADAMALASVSEGLANAWIEALACGTPIVIPDAGGAREVVTADSAGRIVARDATAIREGLEAVLANSAEPGAVRAHALGYTWAANTEALHAHLSDLVARRQPSNG